jgi:hypothetical protein
METKGMLLERDASSVAPPTRESATPDQVRPGEGNAKRRGRRPAHTEHWTKVTVVLMDRQVVFLDRLVADIRAANGSAIGRAHLIRALVEALAASDLDLTKSRTETDLTSILATRLQREPAT